VKVSVLQCKIVNKLTYKLEHTRESFSNEIDNKVTLTIIVQMSVKKNQNLFVYILN